MVRLNSSKFSGEVCCNFSSAVPTPNQPDKKNLACPQLNTQGIARKSASDCCPVRLEGREPMRLCSIASIGVACRKKLTNPSRWISSV